MVERVDTIGRWIKTTVSYKLLSGNVGIGTDAPTNGKLVIGGVPTEGIPAINVEPYGANYANTSDITLSSNAVISAQNTINFNVASGSITFNRGGGSRTND